MVEAKFAVVLILRITEFIYIYNLQVQIWAILDNIFVTYEESFENKPTIEYGITDISN